MRPMGALQRPRLRSAAKAALALAGIVWLLGTGCGKKGPPLAPLRLPPERVSDLEALQRGDRIVLSWTAPEIPMPDAPEAPLRLELFELIEDQADESGSRPTASEFEDKARRVLLLDVDAEERAEGVAWLENRVPAPLVGHQEDDIERVGGHEDLREREM